MGDIELPFNHGFHLSQPTTSVMRLGDENTRVQGLVARERGHSHEGQPSRTRQSFRHVG